jgi:hypothetical protein
MAHCRHKKSPGITRAFERAKGLEPSTFTLARRLNPNDINSLAREYGYLAVTGRYLDIQPVTPEWCAKWCVRISDDREREDRAIVNG